MTPQRYTFRVALPLPTAEGASIVAQALSFDTAPLQEVVKRISVGFADNRPPAELNAQSSRSVLHLSLKCAEKRRLRVATNALLQQLHLALRVAGRFGESTPEPREVHLQRRFSSSHVDWSTIPLPSPMLEHSEPTSGTPTFPPLELLAQAFAVMPPKFAFPTIQAGHLSALFGLAFSGFVGYTCYRGLFFVPAGHRAIKFNAIFGLHSTTYGEGANLAIPWVETPIVFDVRQKPTEVVTSSGSKDLQMVNMAVRVLYRPKENALTEIYRFLGMNYPETVLPSVINEIIKAVIAQFNAADLLIHRPEVSNRIAVALQERANRFHIAISDVSITQMSFGKEYTNAVEAKQIAQQMAERAKFRVEQAEQEKKGAILLAEGEAQAASMIGDAMRSNPAFYELRRIEASRRIADAVKQGEGRYYLNADALMLNPSEASTRSEN